MQQIADWLQELGFGQYARHFAENDITFPILPDLTDQDLKEIGVSLGHRRQLLREIANLGKSAGAPPLAPLVSAPPIAASTVMPLGDAAGERRHVTVMFCDLWIRPVSPRSSMLKNGAIWLAPISMPPQQR
jgi:hypothetical protein